MGGLWMKDFLHILLLIQSVSPLPQFEKDALSALYQSTGGSSGTWYNASGWLDW
jgi:hypothetical protein